MLQGPPTTLAILLVQRDRGHRLLVNDVNVCKHYCVFFNVLLNALKIHPETTTKSRRLNSKAEQQFIAPADSIDPNIFNHSITSSVNGELGVLLDRVASLKTEKRSCSKLTP